MLENDVFKMKVSDLKRELELHGLPVTGNKTELQGRLQSALILVDDDLSVEDTAVSEDDVLALTEKDDEVILTLLSDENELLKCSTSELNSSFSTDKPVNVPAPQAEEIVLKRKILITALPTETPEAVKEEENENNLPAAKIPKTDEKPRQIIQFSALTLEERLRMRAKKFGLDESQLSGLNVNARVAGAGAKAADPKQIEILKKRAERFGCEVSSTIVKITTLVQSKKRKLKKRKQRFGKGHLRRRFD